MTAKSPMTVESMQAHYAAVRARLRGNAATPRIAFVRAAIPPAKPLALPPPSPDEPPAPPALPPPLSYEVQMAVTRERLRGMAGLSNRRRLLLLTILEEHDAYWIDMINDSRRHDTVLVRHELYVALFNDGMSLSAIGRAVNRDHATVLYSLRKNPDLAKRFKIKPKRAKYHD